MPQKDRLVQRYQRLHLPPSEATYVADRQEYLEAAKKWIEKHDLDLDVFNIVLVAKYLTGDEVAE